MAKKKSKEPTHCIAVLEGGPRDGQEMRLKIPPPPYMRLAFPEWCAYVLDSQIKAADKNRPAQHLFKHVGGNVSDEMRATAREF